MSDLLDKTTVEEAADGDLIIVGEKHHGEEATYSARLATRVAHQYDPAAVAIEQPPRSRPFNGGSGMGALVGFAKQKGCPLYHIDKSSRYIQKQVGIGVYADITEDANHFSHPIEEDGDVDPEAITDARSRVRTKFGDDAANTIYDNREKHMAKILRHVVSKVDGPVVAAVGAFHVHALKREYENTTAKIVPKKERKFEFKNVR